MTLNIIAGLLGIVLYTLIKARPFVFNREVRTDWQKLLRDNVPAWIWAFFVLLAVAIILHLEPKANDIIGHILGGVDLTNNFVGFLGLGMLLSFGTKEAGK